MGKDVYYELGRKINYSQPIGSGKITDFSKKINPIESCKANNGVLKDNFCIIKNNEQEIIVSLWNQFTREQPEKHFDNNDIKNVVNLAKKQPHTNWHFYSKEERNKTTFYKSQAYEGKFPKGEYYGWKFLVNKEGKIIEQR